MSYASHRATAFLGTDSSCGQGKEHKGVTGGGYWGVTILGLSGRFEKFLEEKEQGWDLRADGWDAWPRGRQEAQALPATHRQELGEQAL